MDVRLSGLRDEPRMRPPDESLARVAHMTPGISSKRNKPTNTQPKKTNERASEETEKEKKTNEGRKKPTIQQPNNPAKTATTTTPTLKFAVLFRSV